MTVPLRLIAGDVVLTGELFGGALAEALRAELPLSGTLRRFGDSYYIETPVNTQVGPEADDEVPVGALAYWPAAQALMLFFGETPESVPGSGLPVAPSDVEIVGRFTDVSALATAPEPTELRFEAG